MKLYKLPIILYEPCEDTEYKYMAEVPSLPGCRVWGDSPSQALEYIQNMAETFVESYRERGHPAPADFEALVYISESPVAEAVITIAP